MPLVISTGTAGSKDFCSCCVVRILTYQSGALCRVKVKPKEIAHVLEALDPMAGRQLDQMCSSLGSESQGANSNFGLPPAEADRLRKEQRRRAALFDRQRQRVRL